MLVAALLASSALASPGGVVVSEFRTRGPAGGNDEFVEVANASGSAVDVSGYRLQGCASSSGSPSDRAAIPQGTVLEPGQRYLFTNTATSGYGGDVAGDRAYSTGFTDFAASNASGLRLLDASGGVVDGAGSPNSPCREGSGMTTPTTNGDNSYERRDGGTADTDVNADDFEGPKPGDPQNLGSELPKPKVTKIHDVQGAGPASPLQGERVTIEGVVTGIDDEVGASFGSGNTVRTFPEDAGIFVQEETPDADGDPQTSEGVFVGYVRDRGAYEVGDVVRLNGEVREKFGQTIVSEAFGQEPQKVGMAPAPEPVAIDARKAAAQDPDARPYYETLEGMRVRLAAGTANSGGTNKFGELFLTPGFGRDRVFRTEAAPALISTDADAGAGDPANPYRDGDGSSTEVEADLFDVVTSVAGPLGFGFGNYKVMVQPGATPRVYDTGVRYPYSGVPDDEGLRVASFNVENYFPAGGELDGGTVSEEEFAEKTARLSDAIGGLLRRPDVVAVQEVYDIGTLRALAASLGGYTAYLEEGNDSRGIDVGFLVRDTVRAEDVRQLGKEAPNPTSARCSDRAGLLFDRPPLAAEIVTPEGERFTVLSNHFSSKSAPDACREAQAAFVRDRVAEMEAAGEEVVVAGDLNAFEDEGALAVLQDGATTLTNLWSEAPAEERYSFAFSGRLQTLDHVLVTDGLRPLVEGFRYAHFDNDYHERDGSPDGHKVSDHDPPVLTLSEGEGDDD